MSDSELVCNFKKCRKRITSHAWVTSCSHVFCEEDGEREFTRQPIKCPACNSSLPRSIDIIKVDLNPSEQFKAMVLAGLRPEIVMDVASRAISFWSYQVHLEHMYQENSVKTYKERLSQLEVSYEALVAKIKSEMIGLKRQIEAARKDLAIQMRRAEELAEKLVEKTRQCQKLQAMYDSMKRTTISSTMIEKDSNRHQSSHPSFTLGPRTIADVLPHQSMSMPPPPMSPRSHSHHNPSSTVSRMHQNLSSHQDDFTFRPVTPNNGVRSSRGPSPFQALSHHHMPNTRGPPNH